MGFFEELFGFGEVVVADKAVDKGNNYILFDNFIVQAGEANVFRKKAIPTCSNLDIKDSYFTLFNLLQKIKVIENKSNAFLYVFKGGETTTVTTDKELLKSDRLEKELTNLGSEYATCIECYDVDYNALSTLLSRYENKAIDEVKLVGNVVKKGGRKSSKRVRNRRKNGLRRNRMSRRK